MRTGLVISYICHYALWVVFYLLVNQSELVLYSHKKLLFYYPNAVLILFYLLIGKNAEPYLCQFKKICLFSVLSNFIIIIINWHGLITNTYYLMELFCGLVFVVFTMVLISGKRHGIFKEQ